MKDQASLMPENNEAAEINNQILDQLSGGLQLPGPGNPKPTRA